MKKVTIYNSLTNRQEIFIPHTEGVANIYVCGSTVYDSPHIGNIRPAIVFDVLRRTLLEIGYKVKYVTNYTDVDDKIIKKAIEENVREDVITSRVIEEIKVLYNDLNILPPTRSLYATEYLNKMIHYINGLVKEGFAYENSGDVYFRVDSIPTYGVLSNMKKEDLLIGARIEENSKKETAIDFTLWKSTDVGINWDSPWGKGRPGWHTECVAMIDDVFNGKEIDIHAGGFDLKFPHHENEIAQARACRNHGLAKYWMHNGFINFENQKMSKSLGNVIKAKDAIKEFGPNVVKMTILQSHYRSPAVFSEETISMAKAVISKFENVYYQLTTLLQLHFKCSIEDINIDVVYDSSYEKFIDFLCDDLNVSNAISEIIEKIKVINQLIRTKKPANELYNEFKILEKMFDLLGFSFKYTHLEDKDLELIEQYNLAKINKDFVKSDEIRNYLLEKNIVL